MKLNILRLLRKCIVLINTCAYICRGNVISYLTLDSTAMLKFASKADSAASLILCFTAIAHNHSFISEFWIIIIRIVFGGVLAVCAVIHFILLRRSERMWMGEVLRKNKKECKFLLAWEVFWTLFFAFNIYLHLSPDE